MCDAYRTRAGLCTVHVHSVLKPENDCPWRVHIMEKVGLLGGPD